MFAVDQFIDTVQNGKKYFVSSFVTDETVRKSLNAFVDAQTEFTKQIVKTNNDMISYFADQSLKYKAK
jgi:hypothetical protein